MSSRFRLNLKEDTDSRVLKSAFHGVPETDYSKIKRPLTTISLKKWNGIQHARLL